MEQVRILLADDHAVVRAGIRNALQELPNLDVVGEVGDGPELFAALAKTRPDFLLIDVTMPNFEPVSAIRQIRADYPAMKILVVSAYDDDFYVQGLLGAGVNGYHLKNQPLSDLRLAVQRVLAGEKWISSRLVDKLVSPTGGRAVPPLTARQREILRLLQQGYDNHTIAKEMCLSVKTVENHLTRLYRQLQVQSRLEAVNYVMTHPEVLAVSGQEAMLAVFLPETPARERVTILLVDDNGRYRRQLRRVVGKAYPQAVIYEAENTREALRLIEGAAPQLVLVDVVLGDEDGIQCTRRIKAQLPNVRVILISAYPDRGFRQLGLEAGAVAFLDKKDLDTATLRQVIEDVMGCE
ncbi:MAG: response regulator [Anaerolineae bacterium]|nr:response regulator [Anaerolineae bacterium]